MRNVTPPSRTVSLTSMENHGLTAGKCFSLRMFHFIIEQNMSEKDLIIIESVADGIIKSKEVEDE